MHSKSRREKIEYRPADFISNSWIKRDNPQTECQLVLDLKADFTTQGCYNSATQTYKTTKNCNKTL